MVLKHLHKGLLAVSERLSKYKGKYKCDAKGKITGKGKPDAEFKKALDDFDELRHAFCSILEHQDMKRLRDTLNLAFGPGSGERFAGILEELDELKSIEYDLSQRCDYEKLDEFLAVLSDMISSLEEMMGHEAYRRVAKEIENLEGLKQLIERLQGIVD